MVSIKLFKYHNSLHWIGKYLFLYAIYYYIDFLPNWIKISFAILISHLIILVYLKRQCVASQYLFIFSY